MPATVGASPLPEDPITASSYVGTAISGASVGHVGVSGSSLPLPPGVSHTQTAGGELSLGDGVFGEGKNGIHGVSANGLDETSNGVLGENAGPGFGVAGTSAKGTGVRGVNGGGSATTPRYGCGVWGESEFGVRGLWREQNCAWNLWNKRAGSPGGRICRRCQRDRNRNGYRGYGDRRLR